MLVEAKILGLAVGGAFVGRITNSPQAADVGKKVFVRGAGPEELVEVEVEPSSERFYTGRLVRVIEPSTERIVPDCPVFGTCGGCDLQQLTIAAQRRLKVEMVASMLARQGGLVPIDGVRLCGTDSPGFAYRQRVTVHLSPEGALGFYRSGTGDVVPISRCPIARPGVSDGIATLAPLGALLAKFFRSIVIEELSSREVAFVFRALVGVHVEQILQALPESLHPVVVALPNLKIEAFGEVLFEQWGGRPVADSASLRPTGHFAQVNAIGNQSLLELVLAACPSTGKITELFAGSGNFGLPLAARGNEVDAVELDPSLVLHGQTLARERNLPIRFVHQRCEHFVAKHRVSGVVLLDPPRTGAKEVVTHLNPTHVSSIVYISCDLPTLVRDLKILVAKGFTLAVTHVVDMFPQTHHVETVSVLHRATSR